MNHQELYKLLVTVQKNVRCPQCGKAYDFGAMQIRGIVDSIVFLELSCQNHMPLLATVTLSKQTTKGKSSVMNEKVKPDDVIETYRMLRDWKGSFQELFAENEPNNSK